MSELLSCPFCGGNASRRFTWASGFMVGCHNDNCPINPKTRYFRTMEQPDEVWNARSQPLSFRRRKETPCPDCVDGFCDMNCGPCVPLTETAK
jgi:hypothetical protein